MERGGKRKKTKNRESVEERSPLQHLNGLPIHRRNTKTSSDFSSSSSSSASAVSRFLLSDNPCSSSSKTHSDKTPNIYSKIAKNEPNKSRVRTPIVVPRSKENETPRKPFLQTSRKDKPKFTMQTRNSQSDAKPTCKNRQRSKLSSVHGISESNVKKGYQMKNSEDNGSGKFAFGLNKVSNDSNSNRAENCTPLSGRVASGCDSHSLNFYDHKSDVDDDLVHERGNANAANDVKTPPVEASLSPEIHCQSQSKMPVLRSVGTPVCYGAGHLVSGVSDKRKSKRRGSLKGGPKKIIPFLDAMRDENVSVDLHESSIPLPTYASIRWHLSPCDIGCEEQDRMVCGDDSGTLDLLSSPSMLCGNTLGFLCANSSYNGSGRVRNVEINRRKLNAIFSSIKATEFPGILESLSCNMDETLLAASPKAAYSCNGISSTEGKCFSKSPSRDNSIISLGSLNSGNIIQTPDLDSSSDACFRRSRLELDPITETLERVKLPPRNEISMWDAPGLGSYSADIGSPPTSLDPIRLKKNIDSVSSWVSDNTFDDLTLSQMRISCCDGLASNIVRTEEFDCCCCLSDEEIDGDESAGEQLKLYPLTEAAEEKEIDQGNNSGHMVLASVENKENGFRIGNELSPVLLDYEPCLPAEGKGKSLRTNACAESICTDGGGLLASDDSDWTCLKENRLFQVT